MSDRHRRQWDALAKEDPFWAVLTDSRMKGGHWDRAAFFRTGDDEIEQVMQSTAGLGIQIRRGRALDYGCGVGRLSRALADRFDSVVGVDISDNMLQLARAELQEATHVQFVLADGDNLRSIADASIDFLYSNIVLQHAPQPVQRALIIEFCRVLRPGGVLVFQTPSYPSLRRLSGWIHLLAGNRLLNLARRLKYGSTRVMEMHTFRKDRVVELLLERGMSIGDVLDDRSAGDAFVSFRYVAVKR